MHPCPWQQPGRREEASWPGLLSYISKSMHHRCPLTQLSALGHDTAHPQAWCGGPRWLPPLRLLAAGTLGCRWRTLRTGGNGCPRAGAPWAVACGCGNGFSPRAGAQREVRGPGTGQGGRGGDPMSMPVAPVLGAQQATASLGGRQPCRASPCRGLTVEILLLIVRMTTSSVGGQPPEWHPE